jgi:transposase-like protein
MVGACTGTIKVIFHLPNSSPACHTRRMNMLSPTNLYKRHRFPAEIISHCVWLYFCFCLSYRGVEELMAERGVILTYEAGRHWGRKFGQAYANQLRRRRPRPDDKWHLGEVCLTTHGSTLLDETSRTAESHPAF